MALGAEVPADWPHRQASRRLAAGGLRWHAQIFGPPPGSAPAWLLLHGTGASCHSWREVVPALQALRPACTLIVPDLPGHAWTTRPAADADLGLPGMSAALGALLAALGVTPQQLQVLIGHSAGAAIAGQLCLDGHAAAHTLVSLNGAWLPPAGLAGHLYSPMAKLLAWNPAVPQFFAWQAARPAALQRLVASTGSRIDAQGQALYARLVSDPAHVGAVLAMMAQWDLQALQPRLPQLGRMLRLHLVAAENDTTVPPQQAQAVAARVPRAQLHRVPGLGHLAHEESPQQLAALVLACLDATDAANAADAADAADAANAGVRDDPSSGDRAGSAGQASAGRARKKGRPMGNPVDGTK